VVPAYADDEIQVYTGEIAEVGKWTGQHHFNYAIVGRKQPEFPGGLVPNHTLNATPEFAYGVTDWFEAGFYVPWAIDNNGYHSNAMKLRTLFVTPNAAKREFFYGLNIEYQYLMSKFADTRWGMEIRPIIGWRNGDYDFIINPIVDLSFGKRAALAQTVHGRRITSGTLLVPRSASEEATLSVERDFRRPLRVMSLPPEERIARLDLDRAEILNHRIGYVVYTGGEGPRRRLARLLGARVTPRPPLVFCEFEPAGR
jgi:hypothetical protein